MQPLTETVDLGKRNVTVRELSAAEIDAWIGARDLPEYNRIFDSLYSKRLLSGDVVLLCTDLTPDELMTIPPHCLEKVIGKIKSLNTFFVQLLEASASRQQNSGASSGAPA